MSKITNNKIIYDFILAATSRNQDIEYQQKLSKQITELKLWSGVYEKAYTHGVFVFIYKILQKLNILDEDVYNRFHLKYIQLIKNNMLMSSELVRVSKLFEEKSIKSVALKGPTLSKILYNNILDRQYSDIDILVDENNVYEAALLLLGNNYKSKIDIKFLKNKTYLSVSKDLSFFNKDNEMNIELHWQLSSKQVKVISNDDFKNYQSVELYDYELKVFANEDLLVYLCIHGSKHLWERLEWIVDIDRLITNSTDLNWNYVLDSVEKLKVRELFLLAMLVTKFFYNTKIPSDIDEMISEKQIKIKEKIVEFLYEKNIAKKSIKFNALQKDDFLGFLSVYIRGYFQIKEGDIVLVDLPKMLSPVYYIIRPVRIIYKLIKNKF